MNKIFTDNAWQDYQYWVGEDKKTLKRINKLIEDIFPLAPLCFWTVSCFRLCIMINFRFYLSMFGSFV